MLDDPIGRSLRPRYRRDPSSSPSNTSGLGNRRSPYRKRRSLPTLRSYSRPRAYGDRFRPKEIGYFDPYLDPKEFGSDDIYEKGSKTYFRLVYLFLNAAKDYARLNSSTDTRRNLSKCLRGAIAV